MLKKILKALIPKKRLYKPKYREGVDFNIVPDLEAAKKNDPCPWNVYFLGRIIKVHAVRLPEKGQYQVDIDAELLYGEPFNEQENNEFGELILDLVARSWINVDK